jgi:hypothetical protein
MGQSPPSPVDESPTNLNGGAFTTPKKKTRLKRGGGLLELEGS